MRQHTIWFTAAHQELYQIDEQLRNTMLSLGTYILGATASMESARQLADALFLRNPYWVKHYRKVWGHLLPHTPLEVIAEEPEFMRLEEQTEIFAKRIKQLGRFQFFLRPAYAEGDLGSEVSLLSIWNEDRDKETGEYQFPEAPLLARLRTALAKQAGIPIARLLQEQEKRLPQILPQQAAPYTLPQPVRHRSQRHNGAQPGSKPANRSVMTNTAPPVPASDVPRAGQALPRPPLQRRHRLSSDGNKRP